MAKTQAKAGTYSGLEGQTRGSQARPEAGESEKLGEAVAVQDPETWQVAFQWKE